MFYPFLQKLVLHYTLKLSSHNGHLATIVSFMQFCPQSGCFRVQIHCQFGQKTVNFSHYNSTTDTSCMTPTYRGQFSVSQCNAPIVYLIIFKKILFLRW